MDHPSDYIDMNRAKRALVCLLALVITALAKEVYTPFLCPSHLSMGKLLGISKMSTNSCLTIHSPVVLGKAPVAGSDYVKRVEKFCNEAYSGHGGTSQWAEHIKQQEIGQLNEKTIDKSKPFFLLWPDSFTFELEGGNEKFKPKYEKSCDSCPKGSISLSDLASTYGASKQLIASVRENKAKKLCFSYNIFKKEQQRIFACDEYFEWDGFACHHSPFDPCEMITDCRFDRHRNLCMLKRSRWSWLLKISCTLKKPTFALEDKCSCDPCKGSEWSDWSRTHATCGTETKRRYRVKTGRPRKTCGEDDEDCCHQRKVVDLGSCGRTVEMTGPGGGSEQEGSAKKSAIMILGVSIVVFIMLVILAKLGTKRPASRKSPSVSPEMSQQEMTRASTTKKPTMRKPSGNYY